jgi:hypothetical protein
MWVNVPTQAPIMIGIFLGALLAAYITRKDDVPGAGPAWRIWGYSSGITVLVACLAEYFPRKWARGRSSRFIPPMAWH